MIRRLVGVGVIALVGVAGVWASQYYPSDWPRLWSFGGDAAGETRLTHQVTRGNLIITVTEDGNVESASNIDIRCMVAGGAVIKSIVNDGTIVKQGEQLVELDSSAIDEQILTQRIAYEKARAVRDQAQNDLQAAKIALREYVEGTFVKELQTFESQITVAQENLRSAQNTLEYTDRMFRKGYVTSLQQEAQQFAVKRAGLEMEMAQTAKRVLQDFTFEKMKNDFETLVSTSEAKSRSEQAAFELEESKLKRLETQKINCIILAPQSGMVVYANESGGRFSSSDRPKIEEGATVRESQVILRVPDLSQMQVKVTVHESKVESLRIGMPASIRIQNRKLTGYVTSIANQPEPTMMFSSGVKEYAAYVRIEGEQTDLKPGMTAEVEILIDERKNVLTVPIQCLVEQVGKFYCWRVVPGGAEKTLVAIGAGDDRNIEVRQGLAEGDVVLQSPPERSVGSFTSSRDAAQFGAGRRGGEGGKPADGAPADPASSGPDGGKPTGAVPDIMSFDKNGDGKISRDEAPEAMRAFFDKIDTDADGFISPAEAQAARARRGVAGGGPPGAGPAGGASTTSPGAAPALGASPIVAPSGGTPAGGGGQE